MLRNAAHLLWLCLGASVPFSGGNFKIKEAWFQGQGGMVEATLGLGQRLPPFLGDLEDWPVAWPSLAIKCRWWFPCRLLGVVWKAKSKQDNKWAFSDCVTALVEGVLDVYNRKPNTWGKKKKRHWNRWITVLLHMQTPLVGSEYSLIASLENILWIEDTDVVLYLEPGGHSSYLFKLQFSELTFID